MSTLNGIKQLQFVPRIDWLIKFGVNNYSYSFIVRNVIVSLNKCVEENDEILDQKNIRGNFALRLMKYGVIFTTIFIIYVIVIFY